MEDIIIVATNNDQIAYQFKSFFSKRNEKLIVSEGIRDLLTSSCVNDVRWIIVDNNISNLNGLNAIHFCKQYRPSILAVLLVTDEARVNSAHELSETDIVINGPITDNKLASLVSLMATTRFRNCTYEKHRRIMSWTYLRFSDTIPLISQMGTSAVNFAFQTHFRKGAFRSLSIRLTIQNEESTVRGLLRFDSFSKLIENAIDPLCYEILTMHQYCNVSMVINYDERNDGKITELMNTEFIKNQSYSEDGFRIYMFVSNTFGDMSEIQFMKDETRSSG